MKKLIFSTLFSIGLGVLSLQAQNMPSTPDPAIPPAQTDQDNDPIVEQPNGKEFPPDLVDTTISDTSEIPETRIDSSSRMESKDSIMDTRKKRIEEDRKKKISK